MTRLRQDYVAAACVLPRGMTGTIRFDESFNWLAVLKDLCAGMPLSFDERKRLNQLAREWPTCACGQLCAALPRDKRGVPRDIVLFTLGAWFAEHVCAEEWLNALTTFRMIEARTAELLGSADLATDWALTISARSETRSPYPNYEED